MKPGKSTYVTSEKARKTHSRSKLHKFMQDEYDPVGGMRDSQKIKNLVEWQRLWSESQGTPTDAIEGRTSLEELGERWDEMDRSERGSLLRQVNVEEYLLGHTSLGKSIGLVYQGDKYYNPKNLGKPWKEFSDEDKKKKALVLKGEKNLKVEATDLKVLPLKNIAKKELKSKTF